MNPQSLTFSHIVAVSKNNMIGLNNKLPWHIPEDLKYFYKTTENKVLIMGRKTFDSIGHALPNRLNVVLTKNKKFKDKEAVSFSSIDQVLKYCQRAEIQKKYGNEIFITGGGEIYKQTLSMTDRLYITRIHKEYEGDASYPEIPENQFQEVSRIDKAEPQPFSFLIYERIKQ